MTGPPNTYHPKHRETPQEVRYSPGRQTGKCCKHFDISTRSVGIPEDEILTTRIMPWVIPLSEFHRQYWEPVLLVLLGSMDYWKALYISRLEIHPVNRWNKATYQRSLLTFDIKIALPSTIWVHNNTLVFQSNDTSWGELMVFGLGECFLGSRGHHTLKHVWAVWKPILAGP